MGAPGAVDRSPWFDRAIRVGFVCYGVVNLVVAWLALQLAFGKTSGKVTSTGALNRIAREPLGEVLLWLIAAGMLVLTAWRVIDAIWGHTEEDDTKKRTGKRLGSAFKAALYLVLAISAIQILTGSSGGGGGTDSMTAKLMDLPFGRWLVGLVGLGVIGYGVKQIVTGLSEKFAKHLTAEGKSGETGKAYLIFGKVGYVAKGLAVGLVGALFLYAAWTHVPKKSGGLDVALETVRRQPYGQVLLLLIAAGIACYGLFTFARARHLSR